jgi:ribonuclease VapC
MFVDASAILAILTREPAGDCFVAPLLAMTALDCHCERSEAISVNAAVIRAVPITEREAERTLDAFSRYGKGRGHPVIVPLGSLPMVPYAGLTTIKLPR